MKLFEPILQDQPLSYAEQRADFYRNKAREDKWGAIVYFAPSTWAFDQTGTGGAYYKYGHTAQEKLGRYGNCTWWSLARYHEVSGKVETSIIGDAGKTLDRYAGRKEGSLTKNIYLGGSIKAGDCLIFADNLNNTGSGHINFVEKVDDDVVHISESGYSTKTCYKDKACIVYTIKKSLLITATKISLRPVMPYSEYFYGVIHTGDVFDQIEPVERDSTKDQIQIKNSYINIRTEASTSSSSLGYFKQGYYNVTEKVDKEDYTWYNVGGYWCAGVNQVEYIAKDTDYKALYEKAQEKLDKIKEVIANE